jgi:hypothetical protein
LKPRILVRLPGTNELILVEAKLTANAAGKISGLKQFMKKIKDHPSVVVEEGGAALPIKSFVLHVGETLTQAVKDKILTQLAQPNLWADFLPESARKITSEILK